MARLHAALEVDLKRHWSVPDLHVALNSEMVRLMGTLSQTAQPNTDEWRLSRISTSYDKVRFDFTTEVD